MSFLERYFTLDAAIKSPSDTKTNFIIANEYKSAKGETKRFYSVFSSFKEFYANRHHFMHSHELLVDHCKNKVNTTGRLVFDFDIPKAYHIPSGFKYQIEDVIVTVLEKYFRDVDTNKLVFVWSTSINPKKFSKHLTVKNVWFDNWITLSRIFYKLFHIEFAERYDWINPDNLIDFQIVRKRASLRMVGSSKINGCALVIDDDLTHKFTDSLIRIYLRSDRKIEQKVTMDNLNPSVLQNVLDEEPQYQAEPVGTGFTLDTDDGSCLQSVPSNYYGKPKHFNHTITFDSDVYDAAFKMICRIQPNVFAMGKIEGPYIALLRQKPSRCLMSEKIHESDNSYLLISRLDYLYSIRFGCHRRCADAERKTIKIGSISVDNLIIILHPDFRRKISAISS